MLALFLIMYFLAKALKVAERIKPKHVYVIVIFKFNKYLF